MSLKILIVDDEPNILNSLDRLLHRSGFEVIKAEGGEEALAAMDEYKDIAVVISDQRMPGMNGAEVLKEARIRCPDAVRIGLTGYADIDTILRCINEARVTRFILKPWDDELLLELIAEASIIFNSSEEDKRLQELAYDETRKLQVLNAKLERMVARTANIESAARRKVSRSMKGMAELVAEFAEGYEAGLPGHSRRVARLSKEICKATGLSEDETDDIIIAALLHDIGKESLSPTLSCKPANELTDKENMMVQRHPVTGFEILAKVDGFEKIARIVRHHHEAVSGKGYPDKLTGIEIPVGSKIIAIVDMYDRCLFPSDEAVIGSHDKAVEMMSDVSGEILDGGFLEVFMKIVLPGCRDINLKEVEVPVELLKPGMDLARDVVGLDGDAILTSGTTLDDEMIGKLVMKDEFDSLLCKIYINGESLPTRLVGVETTG